MRGAAPTLSLRGTAPDRLSVFERLFRDRPRGTPETAPAIPPELATLTTPLPMFAGRAVSPVDSRANPDQRPVASMPASCSRMAVRVLMKA